MYDHGVLARDLRSGGAQARAGAPYLVMERMDGTLAEGCGRLPWRRLRASLLAVLDALAHAHARGVLHRDLKPGNVLERGGRLKLADLGLAHPFGINPVADREEQVVAGTPRYMAPEQFENRWRDYGPWTDLYSLGCVGWELAAGAPPFEAHGWLDGMTQHLTRPLPPFAPIHPVPAGFEAWLRVLLRKAPGSRFRCAADAAAALLAVGDVAGEVHGGSAAQGEPVRSEPLATLDLPLPLPPAEPARSLAEDIAPPPTVGFLPRWAPPPRAAPARLPGAGLGLFGMRAVPLVGRAAERTALWHALGDVHRDGTASLVILRGAAGTGKSFLARWLAERAQELGAALAVRAGGDAGRAPGACIEGMLARHLRTAGLPADQVARRIDEVLDGAVGPAGRGLLASVLAPGAAQPRGALIEAAQLWLGSLARERPVVLWLDDAQWDAIALALAEGVLSADPPLPVLIVATIQDEALAERAEESRALSRLIERERTSVVAIAPLPVAQHRQLVDTLLDIDEALAAQLAERTAGNPLFAVELVRDWVERGVLLSGARGFHLAEGADTALPLALSQVWDSRIERLLGGGHPDDAAALELAAVLGLEVEEALWQQAAARVGLTLRPELRDALLERRLASARGPEALAWAHGMLQECLCERARRRGRWAELNAGAAAILAAQGMRCAERAAVCYDAVGDALGAVDSLGNAAAWRLHRGADAFSVLDAMTARLAALELPPSDPRRGRASTLRMIAAYGRGAFADAEAIGGPLLVEAERHGWSGTAERALVVLASIARVHLDPDLALERLARALELGGGAYAMAIMALTEVEHRHRNPLALERAERAAALAEGAAYRALTACALAVVANTAGDVARAEVAAEHAEALNQEVGSWPGLSSVALLRGDLATRRGDLAEARASKLRGVLYARRSGGLDEVLWAELSFAHLELVSGRWAEALERLRPHQTSFAAAPRMSAEAGVLFAAGLGGIGRWDEAERALDAAAGALAGRPVAVRQLGLRARELAALAASAGRDRLAAVCAALADDQLSALGVTAAPDLSGADRVPSP